MQDNITKLYDNIKEGYRPSLQEAAEIEKNSATEDLSELADMLRALFTSDRFDTCSIMNARSGRCSEDCKWCSQSRHHVTNVDVYPLVSTAQALDAGKYNADHGVKRFSLVTSGRAMSDTEIAKSCEMLDRLRSEVKIELCASMGLLSKEQLKRLKDSGISRYHCNLEAAPSYFPTLCSTHTTEDKVRTIRWAQEVGLEVCSGGIIGMGETMEQRLELAVTLRELGIRSTPLNILNPIPGTKLEDSPPMTDDEILRSFAMFRIINPEAELRFAGGRTLIRHLEQRLLRGGVNASILGDMLTTDGSDIRKDKEMIREAGFSI